MGEKLQIKASELAVVGNRDAQIGKADHVTPAQGRVGQESAVQPHVAESHINLPSPFSQPHNLPRPTSCKPTDFSNNRS